MKKYLSKRSLKTAGFALVIFIFFQVTQGCFSFRMSRSEIRKYFAGQPVRPAIHQYKVGKHTINYAEAGDMDGPTVIFVHGAPGSWTAFIDFFTDTTLLHHAHLIAVDRPGNGYSDFGNAVTSLGSQAALLEPLLRKSKKPPILVGHSLGGPVVARLAMDFPDEVNSLIMVAPSIDPELEPNEAWFRMPLSSPFLSWVLPTAFNVANDEIYHLEDQLEDMIPLWKNIKVPVTVIQGKADKLVPPGNANFAEHMLANSPDVEIEFVPGANHFIPWSHPELIKDAILKHLQKGT